jgi:antitoxin (DNA-binding transcriptional repressor) of toxin-antitoxin stability system
MEIVNIHKAKTTLSSLIERTLKGEEIIIARNGQPVVSLKRIVKKKVKRKGGQFKGRVRIAKDFDILPQELLKYFE